MSTRKENIWLRHSNILMSSMLVPIVHSVVFQQHPGLFRTIQNGKEMAGHSYNKVLCIYNWE